MKRILLVLFVCFAFSFPVFSQENQNETSGAQPQTGSTTRQEGNTSSQNTTPAEPAGTPQTTGTVDLGTLVLGASPYGRSLQDLPFNVTVINRQAIEDSGAMSIVDAAWGIPGVQIWSTGGYNSVATLRIRNGVSKETVVAINGIRIMTDSTGGANLNLFGAEMFESMEIMRGFGSMLYGSDGTGGFVNLVTRRVAQGSHLTAGVQFAHGGLYGLIKTYVQGSFGAETFHALASISYLDQKGIKIPNTTGTGFTETLKGNSDATNTSSLITFGFNNEKSTITNDFTTVITNSTYGSPGSDEYPDTHSRFDMRNYIFGNTTGIKLGDKIDLKMTLFLNHSKYHDYERSTTGNDDIFRFYRYGFDLSAIFKPVNKLVVAVGVGQTMYRAKENSSNPANDFNYLEGVTHAFIQADYSISIVQLTAGIRMDYHKGYDDKIFDYGTMFSPTFGVLTNIFADLLKLRLQVSKTHRMPLTPDYLGSWYVPVTNLKPEKSWNYEAGLESSVKKIYTAKAVFFYKRIFDKMIYDWALYPAPIYIVNMENIGFELETVITPLGTMDLPINLRIPLSFSYSRPKNLTSEKIMPDYNNKYTFSFGIEAAFKMGLNIGLYGKYVKNYDSAAYPFPDNYVSYFILDAKIHYRFIIAKKDARFFINLLNLTNKKYVVNGNRDIFGTTRYTMPGFTFMTGFEMKF